MGDYDNYYSSYPAKLAIGRRLRRALYDSGWAVLDEVQGEFHLWHQGDDLEKYVNHRQLREFAEECRKKLQDAKDIRDGIFRR